MRGGVRALIAVTCSQEAHQHKRCPLCKGNAQHAATALRYGRVLKQQAAALKQQKYIQHVNGRILLLDKSLATLKTSGDVVNAAGTALTLIRDMDRYRTETAHMLRKGSFAFRQDDHPLAEPHAALRARALLAALKLPTAALQVYMPDVMYEIRVSLKEVDKKPSQTEEGSKHDNGGTVTVAAVREIFRRTALCASQLTHSRSLASATRLIESAVPAMATYAHLDPFVRDCVSRCLGHLLDMIATMRSTHAAEEVYSSNMLHELILVGLNCLPPLALCNMTDVTIPVQLPSPAPARGQSDEHEGIANTANAPFWREILGHACAASASFFTEATCNTMAANSEPFQLPERMNLSMWIMLCKAAYSALSAVWGRVSQNSSAELDILSKRFGGNVEAALRRMSQRDGGGNQEVLSEVQDLARLFNGCESRFMRHVRVYTHALRVCV